MKAGKLLKAIKQRYQPGEHEDDVKGDGEEPTDAQEDQNAAPDVQEEKDAATDEPFSNMGSFVNKRRGKGTKSKRKISDTEAVTEFHPKLPLSAAKDNEAESSGGAKRRRTRSSTRDVGTTEEETPAASNEQQQHEIKHEVPVHCDKESQPKVASGGKIPRLKKTKPLLKPSTPNFKKLYEAHFNKLESIDSYVQRKNKQLETYRHSVKELKVLSEKTNLTRPAGKIEAAKPSRASMFSPVAVNKKPAEDKRRFTVQPSTKPAALKKPVQKEDAPFRPSVLSTRRINVRFSQATHDNEYKRSLVKTPARMSPYVASSTPKKQTNDGGRTSTVSAKKTPGTFVFSANTSVSSNTPGTNKKPSFDLKQSLTRPLTYKPHTGKLKPFGETKENTAVNKSVISHSHQKNYKQHQVQTREERRTRHTEGRKQKKESMLGAKRGLVMA
ncbi:nucleolar and spindle-associated protein 1-like [Diretmus argenteus]